MSTIVCWLVQKLQLRKLITVKLQTACVPPFLSREGCTPQIRRERRTFSNVKTYSTSLGNCYYHSSIAISPHVLKYFYFWKYTFNGIIIFLFQCVSFSYFFHPSLILHNVFLFCLLVILYFFIEAKKKKKISSILFSLLVFCEFWGMVNI